MNSKLPRILAAASATLAFTCTVVFADEPTSEPKEKTPSKADLKKYDANQDGQLDEAEQAKRAADKAAAHEARLNKYDTNRDGKLDKAEREAETADKEKAKAEKEKSKAEKQAAKEAKKAEKQH